MAQCAHCNSEAPPGVRWCTVCHWSLVRPDMGPLASPFKRLAATIADSFVPFVVLFLAFMGGGVVLGLSGGPQYGAPPGSSGEKLALFVPIVLLLAYAVWAISEFRKGMTPGKRLLGIRVVKEDGSAPGFLMMLVREWLGKWLSAFFFGLGFFWILFDKENQGWHDKFLRTYVIDGRC